MISTKIIFWMTFIVMCSLPLAHSLKCFVCNSQESCKKANLYQCNQMLANSTRSYLQMYHNGVNPNATSYAYECFKEYLQTNSGDTYYKGCIYSNIRGCGFPLVPHMASITKKQDCRQCSGRDGCNPAGRISVDMIHVVAALIVAYFLHYVRH